MGTVATGSLFNNLNDFEAADGGERLIRVQCVESAEAEASCCSRCTRKRSRAVAGKARFGWVFADVRCFLTFQRHQMKENICSVHGVLRNDSIESLFHVSFLPPSLLNRAALGKSSVCDVTKGDSDRTPN